MPPPSGKLLAPWNTSGRKSPSFEIPSPAGPFYPPSPRYTEPASPRIGYSPVHSYFSTSSKVSASRQRTLIEIPRHDPGPLKDRDAPTRSVSVGRMEPNDHLKYSREKPPSYIELQPEMSAREFLGVDITVEQSSSRPINIRKKNPTESTLDPNSRPFTPSGRYHTSSVCISEASSSDIHFFQPEHQFEETGDCYTDYGCGTEEELDFLLEDDPLPADPSTLLPDLETTIEDLNNNNTNLHNNNNLEKNNKSINCNKSIKSSDISNTRLKLSDLSNGNSWKVGSELRTPLLPTPVNFPPFGPSDLGPISKYKYSEEPSAAKLNKESRLLVSGVEQSLNSVTLNPRPLPMEPRPPFINLHKRRSGSADPRGEVSSWGPPSSVSSGGLFTQDLSVPTEYKMSPIIGDRVRPINIRQEHTDLLFFLFYSLHGDALQLVAASLLFERGWRYHKQERVWLARWPGVKPEEKNVLYEKGLYQYFDVATWKRIPGWFRLDYCHLSEKTLVPEDLKTMYCRYAGVMRDISEICDRSIALYGLNGQVCEEFGSLDGKKYMNCIL